MTETIQYPKDYDQNSVDSRVALRTKNVKNAIYGSDVRNAIAQGIEIGAVVSGEARTMANNANVLSLNTKKELDLGIGALTQDSEVVIARGDATTLGNRLNKQDLTVSDLAQSVNLETQKAIKQFIDSKFNEVGGKTPNYFANALVSIAQKIDSNLFNIGFITDNHYQMSNYAPGSLSHYVNIATLSNMVKLQSVISGGDNINGYYDRNEIATESNHVVSTLFNRANADTDIFFVVGNHDSGEGDNGKNKPENVLTEDDLKELYQTNSYLYGETRNNGSLYGFKDYSDFKIRIIWLNSFDLPYTLNSDGTYKYDFLTVGGYQNNQLNWLANTALKLPNENYQVIVFTHAPIPGSFDVAAGQTEITQYNSDVLVSILNAFQSSESYSINDSNRELPVSISCDFSNQGVGTVIALISGHIHQDGQMVYKGINCIETAASLCYSGDSNRVLASLTEDCWDVLSIDTSSKNINIHRFGYGSDRNIKYRSGMMTDTSAVVNGNSLTD